MEETMSKAAKKTSIGIALLVICLSFAFASGGEDYYAKSYSRLSFVTGDVYVQRAGDLGYEEGVVNLVLVEGDKLGTREGRAEINLGNNNFLRLDADSLVDLETLPKSGNDLISIHLLSGRAYMRINNMAVEKEIELHTPDVSYYFLQEGLYRIDVTENKETVILALEGEVEAAGEEGSRVVSQGNMLRASEGYFLAESGSYSETAAGISGESFVDWNRSRDSFYGRSIGRSYLPAELYEYEAELDYYGRWVNEPSYGYVWVPRVSYSSWRPYYNGRWVWYPIIGWTWVSYDPWGWCVSHYGRWHWGSGMGWYWIPTRSWGPGWVHWYRGYNYVGWSPLSYWGHPGIIVNNRYYGRGYRGYYPYNSRALTVVHRNQLQARRISSVSLSQANIRKLGRISLTASQPDVRYIANRDRALATRASTALNRSNIRSVNKSVVLSRGQRASSRSGGKNSSPAANRSAVRSSTVRSGKTPARSSAAASSSSSSVRKYGVRSSETNSARAIRKPAASTSGRRATTFGQPTGESRSSSASSKNNSSARTARQPASLTNRIIKKYEPGTNRSSSSSNSSSRSRNSSSAVKKRSSNSSTTARTAAGSRNAATTRKYSSSRSSNSSSAVKKRSSNSSTATRSAAASKKASTTRKYSSNSAVSRNYGSAQSSRSSARSSARTIKRPSSSAVSSSASRISGNLSKRSASSRSVGIPSRSSTARSYSAPNRSSSSRSSSVVRSRTPTRSALSRTPSRSTSSRSVSRSKSTSVKSRVATATKSGSRTSRSRSSSSRAKKK